MVKNQSSFGFISGYFSVEQMDVTPLWFHQSDTANGRLKQHVMFSFLTTQRRKEYFHAFYGILYYISNTCSLQMGNERNYIIGNKSGPSSQHPVITLTFSDVSFRPLSARVWMRTCVHCSQNWHHLAHRGCNLLLKINKKLFLLSDSSSKSLLLMVEECSFLLIHGNWLNQLF